MVNSKFHLIRSYYEIFFYNFPNIPHLKYTVNSNFLLIQSKTLPTNDFELTVPDLYKFTDAALSLSLCLHHWLILAPVQLQNGQTINDTCLTIVRNVKCFVWRTDISLPFLHKFDYSPSAWGIMPWQDKYWSWAIFWAHYTLTTLYYPNMVTQVLKLKTAQTVFLNENFLNENWK